MNSSLKKIRSIADYQFGKKAGTTLFPEETEILFSRATGRIRFIKFKRIRLATLRPTDGLFSISIPAGILLAKRREMFRCFVNVQNDVTEPITSGGDVFAVHVVKADEEIRAQSEVIILDENNQVLAVGRALLSGPEMMVFKVGVAVKVRHGRGES